MFAYRHCRFCFSTLLYNKHAKTTAASPKSGIEALSTLTKNLCQLNPKLLFFKRGAY